MTKKHFLTSTPGFTFWCAERRICLSKSWPEEVEENDPNV